MKDAVIHALVLASILFATSLLSLVAEYLGGLSLVMAVSFIGGAVFGVIDYRHQLRSAQ